MGISHNSRTCNRESVVALSNMRQKGTLLSGDNGLVQVLAYEWCMLFSG